MRRSAKSVFNVLIREHELALRSFVRSCVDDAEATEDVVQETFLASWRSIDQYDHNRPFAAWLRGIAKNKVLEHYRTIATAHHHSRPLSGEAIENIADEYELLAPQATDAFADRLAALRECLDTLNGDERDTVERRYRKQQSCSVIAGAIGHKLEAVKKRLQRARAKLRDCILGKLKLETDGG